MIDSVNFVYFGNNSCYNNINNIIMGNIQQELKKRNIIYYINDLKCKINSVNIITHLENSYSTNRCISNGKLIAINHGFAIKNYLKGIAKDNQHIINKCDKFIIFNNRWKQEFKHIGVNKNKLHICGSGKIDYLFELQKQIPEEENTICFAPTHNNGIWKTTSSYPKMLDYFDNNKYNFIISPHPFNAKNYIPSTESLCRSKVVIADSGSTIYEAMILGKPVIFPDFLVRKGIHNIFRGSLEDEIYEKQIGYHIINSNNIDNIIEKALNEGVLENQKDFINENYDFSILGKYGEMTVDVIERFLNK